MRTQPCLLSWGFDDGLRRLGQRIRGPSSLVSLKRIARVPLREGVYSRIFVLRGGTSRSPTPSSSSPPCRVLLQSGLQRVEVSKSGESARMRVPPPLLLTRREAGRVGGFNFNYRAVDTAAIKSIAVFGCDIDHTGVGKITKLFPRLGCGIVPNSLLERRSDRSSSVASERASLVVL